MKKKRKKRKLMKVCVDSAQSALKKKRNVEDSSNVKLNTDASTITGFSNSDNSESNENWEKFSSDDRKLSANQNLLPSSVVKHDSDTTCDFDESQSLLYYYSRNSHFHYAHVILTNHVSLFSISSIIYI